MNFLCNFCAVKNKKSGVQRLKPLQTPDFCVVTQRGLEPRTFALKVLLQAFCGVF